MQNADPRVVAGFGAEWSQFDQSEVGAVETEKSFQEYFKIFPWSQLPPNAVGFDVGCGSGRWARKVAPKVGHLHCIDPSDVALAVSRRTLAGLANCSFHLASANEIPLADSSMDFGYSLGVLHHVPNTASALAACVRKLKPGAPFLLYIYYALENRSPMYRWLWRASDLVRTAVAQTPFPLRYGVSQVMAGLVYYPLARSAWLGEKLGCKVDGFPLAYYRHRSFYTMRTDALDRFGTLVEKRFTRTQIETLMRDAGLERINFSPTMPYWCAVGIRRIEN